MGEQIFIQVRFTEDVNINGNVLSYNDALYFTQEEYAAKSEFDIQVLKQQRIDNYVAAVTNPTSVDTPELTVEDLQKTKENLEGQLMVIEEQINNSVNEVV